jgi:glycerophosphoryl diester phosphodiesterase
MPLQLQVKLRLRLRLQSWASAATLALCCAAGVGATGAAGASSAAAAAAAAAAATAAAASARAAGAGASDSSAAAPAFDLQGHRGARGLAPENTLAGFRQALEVGVSTLELDVVMTADDVVVIGHDLRLNPAMARNPDGAWVDAPGPAVRSLDLATLQGYDVGRLKPGTRYAETYPAQRRVDGETMPTLAALFDASRQWGAHAVRFNIETKLNPLEPALSPAPEVFARAVLDVVEQHGMAGRVTVQSFDWRTLQAVQRLAPHIPTVALTARQPWLDNVADPRWTAGLTLAAHGGSVPRLVKASGAAVWSPHHADLDATALAEARALGLPVIVWTVNAPADIERMLALGVSGIISDHPDRVRTAMQARGMALPAPLKLPP